MNRIMKTLMLMGLSSLMISGVSNASNVTGKINDSIHKMIPKISADMNHPTILAALKSANAKPLEQENIQRLDTEWRKNIGNKSSTLIKSVIDSETSKFLVNHLKKYNMTLADLFVVDAQGMNIGLTSSTEDYWQADEEKFQETFNKGCNTEYHSDAYQDDSINAMAIQIGGTICENGKPIGAWFATVNTDKL